jgi:hypothetical protein
MGGLRIAYAPRPMNNRTGITIGGTKYFIVFPFKESWVGGISR